MPSLIRFLMTIGLICGAIYGAMFALVMYVEPTKREMTERVPTDKINPVRQEVQPAASDSIDENASQ
ncbi:hypothetical protein [Ahrensia marina]|jgi:hypothetical protein|uniref:hypothetical protein n=1 Tax=Ahrensia marina TaxID=1514904 RepID=UPI0006B6805D|nr:hypothetical protein [Ahrensia marina]